MCCKCYVTLWSRLQHFSFFHRMCHELSSNLFLKVMMNIGLQHAIHRQNIQTWWASETPKMSPKHRYITHDVMSSHWGRKFDHSYSQFGVGSCCTSVVPLLFIFCTSAVHLLSLCCSSHVFLLCLSSTSCTFLALSMFVYSSSAFHLRMLRRSQDSLYRHTPVPL